MKEKLRIPFPIIVEGKYDKQRIHCIADATILTTDGFAVFNKNEKTQVYRKLAEKTKIIVLTDSDGAGQLIRSHICSAVPKDKLIQVYIPKIEGKEKRKAEPSREGTLGVEGMDQDLLYRLLSPYTDEQAVIDKDSNPLNKADLYEAGLSGKPDSADKRDKLCRKLGLPTGMNSNALLAALRLLITYEEYKKTVQDIT